MRSYDYYAALSVAQNTTLTSFVILILFWSFTFLQQRTSFFSSPRMYISIPWMITCIFIFILQIAFMFAMMNVDSLVFFKWNVYLIPAAVIFSLFVVLLEFYLKHRFAAWYKQEQLYMQLEFNTKLGMYSPVSPFK